MEEIDTNKEPNFRLNIKQSAKGEKYYEYTVRADDIETLTIRQQEIKRLAEIECNKEGVKNE